MALRTEGKYSYGDSQEDIKEFLTFYSTSNGYPAEHFADAVCTCGSRSFRLYVDDNEGVAQRACIHCGHLHYMGDSAEYAEDAELEECECPCGLSHFEVTVGVALYPKSEDVKWLYVGGRCPECSLIGCYGDWKNEFSGYRGFLNLI
jgi:hypothetical protein